MLRYALLRVRDMAMAEDIVQETFLAALKARGSFAGKSSEKNWLAAILKNKVVDHMRRVGRETSVANLEFLKDEQQDLMHERGRQKNCWIHKSGPRRWAAPEASLDRKEFWKALTDCCAKLPDNIARVFMMREMDELDTKKICETMNISANNLSVMLHRARMALRRCLETNWFGSK